MLRVHELPGGLTISAGTLPEELHLTPSEFDVLWRLHPKERNEIWMHGRLVRTPRYQQAYGHDYRFTGQVNRALPVPSLLEGLLRWSSDVVDPRLNGILVNWYDLELGHYIGRHSDDVRDLVKGAPIVTISFGADRVFRLRPRRCREKIGFVAANAAVFVMPWETNLSFTHEIPRRRPSRGRRISVTIRAFVGGPTTGTPPTGIAIPELSTGEPRAQDHVP